MGAICILRISLVTSLNELVGYKAGVALDRERMQAMVDPQDAELIGGPDDDMVRVRSEEVEEIFCALLYGVGNIPAQSPMPSAISLFHQLADNPRLYSVYERLSEEYPAIMTEAMGEALAAGTNTVSPKKFIDWAKKECGPDGAMVALAMLRGLNHDLHKSPFTSIRTFDWKNVADLSKLFESENLTTPHGEFFDQRYIDYLSHHFEDIGKINWRQFEGFTAEFFHKNGHQVEIGKGRNDGSIDVRVWAKGKNKRQPPTILVQCKRQQEKVEKVVVKALYADVLEEKAKLGLVVTSSALAPGAKKVCSARSYPIQEANRDTLKKWVNAMRTPYSGIFLGD